MFEKNQVPLPRCVLFLTPQQRRLIMFSSISLDPTVHPPLVDMLIHFHMRRAALMSVVCTVPFSWLNLIEISIVLFSVTILKPRFADYHMARMTFGVATSSLIGNICGKDSPRHFKIYVSNRVSQIMDLIPPDRWNHVTSSENLGRLCLSWTIFYWTLKPSALVEPEQPWMHDSDAVKPNGLNSQSYTQTYLLKKQNNRMYNCWCQSTSQTSWCIHHLKIVTAWVRDSVCS